MAAARILLVIPGPLCRNPRVLKEATSLGRAGFDVTVLSVAQLERFEVFEREIMRTAPFRKRSLDLTSATRASRARAWASRLGGWAARRAVRFGFESPEALGPYRALARLAAQTPADLTLVHTEAALCIGRHLLSRGRRVAADFEDWHSEDLLPDAQVGRPLRLLRRVERDLMQRATYTSTTSHALAAALQRALGGATPVVLTNSFPLQPDPARSPHAGPPAFFWFSQTIGPGRGLEPFLAAWRQTRPTSRVCLLGDVSDAFREELLRSLPAERRASLEFLPITSPEALPSLIARHDIGLALEASTPASRNLTITNKILQYLNAGLPVVASDTAGQREVLGRAPDAGLLVTLADTATLTQKLDAVLADPARLAAMSAAARRAAENIYCWEKEEPRLLAAVQGALAAPLPAPS